MPVYAEMGGFIMGAGVVSGGGAGPVRLRHHLDDPGRRAGVQQHRIPSGAGGDPAGRGGGAELCGRLHPGSGDHYGAPEPPGDGFLSRPADRDGDPGRNRRRAAGKAGPFFGCERPAVGAGGDGPGRGNDLPGRPGPSAGGAADPGGALRGHHLLRLLSAGRGPGGADQGPGRGATAVGIRVLC